MDIIIDIGKLNNDISHKHVHCTYDNVKKLIELLQVFLDLVSVFFAVGFHHLDELLVAILVSGDMSVDTRS